MKDYIKYRIVTLIDEGYLSKHTITRLWVGYDFETFIKAVNQLWVKRGRKIALQSLEDVIEQAERHATPEEDDPTLTPQEKERAEKIFNSIIPKKWIEQKQLSPR